MYICTYKWASQFLSHNNECMHANTIHGSPLRYNFWTTSNAPSSPVSHKARATVLQEGHALSVRKTVEYTLGSCLLSYCCWSSSRLEFGIWSQTPTSISRLWTLSRTLDKVASVNDGSMHVCICMCVCVCGGGHVYRCGQCEHQCIHQN